MRANVIILMAIFAGSVLPLQFALNASLARSAKAAALFASFVSLSVSALSLLLLMLALRVSLPSLSTLRAVPYIYWFGGLGGAIFVLTSTFAIPRIGAAFYMSVAISGQLLMSATLDHFGLLGLPQLSLTPLRVLGIALVASGVLVLGRT